MAGIFVGVFFLYQQFCQLFRYIRESRNGRDLHFMAVWHDEYHICGAEMNVVLRKFAEYGYNYRRAYEYYKDKYQDELLRQRKIVMRLKARRRAQDRENSV